MEECQIGDETAVALGTSLQRLVNLNNAQIWLRKKNSIGSAGAKAIAGGLKCLSKLTSLTLGISGNPIGDEGGKHIAAALASLTVLTQLTFQMIECQIGDETAMALGTSLQQLVNLNNAEIYLR